MTEDTFFADLFGRLPAPAGDLAIPPGDDCAAVNWTEDTLLLLACDQLVGDRHYWLTGPAATSPRQAGRKLLARNLSDIAAMGGTPRFCLVSLAFPPTAGSERLNQYLDGITALGQEFDCQMIGGDLAAAPHDEIGSLTVVGWVGRSTVCRRRGARVGDIVCATGEFGDSLRDGHHLTFTPRCREGQWLAATGLVHAMIDVSDGLVLDLSRICRASGVGAQLDCEAVPRRFAETTTAAVLTAGEDYELLFTVPAGARADLIAQWPFGDVPLTVIGRIVEGVAGTVEDASGQWLSGAAGGYDHFSSGQGE